MIELERNTEDYLPSGWSLCRLKDVVSCNDESLPETTSEDLEIEYVEIGNVNEADGITSVSHYRFGDAPSRARRITRKNDVIISTVRTYLKAIAEIDRDGLIVSTGFAVLRPNGKVRPSFLHYAVQSNDLLEEVIKESTGISYPAIQASRLLSLPVVVPPLDEQLKIAEYLDSKLVSINSLLRIKQKVLGKLKLFRQVKVDEVITHGLRANVSMKDSGEKWLGAVPAHWVVGRIGSFFEERREQVSDTEYPPLSVTKQGVFPQIEGVAKTDNGENRKKVCIGDFVINSRSDRKGSSGVSKYEGSVSLINIVLTSNSSILPDFCNYLFKSHRFIEEYYRVGHGIVADLWTTGFNDMRTINIAVPPLDEQKEITAYLDSECEKIDQKCALIEQQIEKLQLLKRALINEVVTGKRRIQ